MAPRSAERTHVDVDVFNAFQRAGLDAGDLHVDGGGAPGRRSDGNIDTAPIDIPQ